MYTFMVKDAEVAIRAYQQRHLNSKAVTKALNGDCAAMMELYEKLCGPIEQVVEEGPSDDATFIISEAVNRKYAPAMVRFARDTMCLGDEYWVAGLMMLLEAYKLGSHEAMTQLKCDWHNCVKDVAVRYRAGGILNKYEEFMLAFYYYYGLGAEKDETLANKLFLSSAKRGCEEAKKILQDIRPKAIESLKDNIKKCDRNMTMVVRVVLMYPCTCTDADYYEGERIRIDPDAISASYRILENANQDEALDGREDELSKSFDYELHNGRLCAIIDGEFVPYEDDVEFEDYLRRRDGVEMW